VNPSEMQPSSSVEVAIWVAVGGRGTLAGAMVGALLVNGAKSWLTAAFPAAWLYFLGALFVLVTLLLPGGMIEAVSALSRLRRFLPGAPRPPKNSASVAPPPSPIAVEEGQKPVQ
jgi:urea transport system permease protein